MRFFTLTIAICLLAANLCAQTQPPVEQFAESKEVKAVVEQFCNLDAAGTWLGPERWDERQAFLNNDWPWSRRDSISVIKSYQIGDVKSVPKMKAQTARYRRRLSQGTGMTGSGASLVM